MLDDFQLIWRSDSRCKDCREIVQLTTILLFQRMFVRPIHAKITESAKWMNLKNIFVLVYKELQALIVKVENYIYVY